MSKKAAVQPFKDEVKVSEVAMPIIENNVPVTTEAAPSEPDKLAATAAAVAKVAAKPKLAKKAVAAKPAKKVVADTPAPKAPPAKPVKKVPAKAKEIVAEVPKAAKASKEKKPALKKPKLVRDSFTIPESDYALFEALKQRALKSGIDVKKSEILRAALVTLDKLDDAELVNAFGLVERIKTGRPKK